MDITRRRTKKGFYYKNQKTCKVIKSKKLLKHIATLNIPPAYEDVMISSNMDDKVLAISRDDKDRKQYTYNPKYIEEQQEIKFCDLIHFGRKLKSFNASNVKDSGFRLVFPYDLVLFKKYFFSPTSSL